MADEGFRSQPTSCVQDSGAEPRNVSLRSRRQDGGVLRERILALAEQRPRFGYRRIWVLLRREGHWVNAKRVYRLYRLERLKLRTKKRKRYPVNPEPHCSSQTR